MAPPTGSRTALWLSHHWPEDYDRCATVGRSHVCRRCLWFWPACLGTMVLALAGVRWPVALDPWLLFLLPVPVVVEWWAEHLHLVRYSPSRQVVLSVLAAPAVGVGLARYLESPGDTLFWGVVAVYAVVCLVPVLIGGRTGRTGRAGPPDGAALTDGTVTDGAGAEAPGCGTSRPADRRDPAPSHPRPAPPRR